MSEDWAKERLEKEEEGRLRGALEGCGASSRGTWPQVHHSSSCAFRRAPRVPRYGSSSCETFLGSLPRFDEEIRERSHLVNNSYVVSEMYRFRGYAMRVLH